MSPGDGGIVVRPLEGMDEYREAVRFQESIWGEGFSERVPVSLMKVSQRLGGVAAGAFDGHGAMVGFVFGITGLEAGVPVHWSDMLAVRAGLRDGGLGRRMKAYQRGAVLSQGVRIMRWTFDPLESRNAYLNVARLGAVVREYAPDMYGTSDSPLHRGLGTDRFVVTWELDSPRVRVRLEASGAPHPGGDPGEPDGPVGERLFEVDFGAGDWPRPALAAEVTSLEVAPPSDTGTDALRVPIPADIQSLRDAEPALAVAWRRATRAALGPALAAGWEVREVVRGGPVSEYVLGPSPEREGPSPDSGHEPRGS